MKKIVRKKIPFDFVIEELAELDPIIKPMFGCYAVYIEEKIVMILREKKDKTKRDDGVWLATQIENHKELIELFPSMRSIELFGTPPTAWQTLSVTSKDFEDSVLRACQLILEGSPLIGRIPKKKLRKTSVKSRSK
ncbi:TfoX/Sxy family protein [bacterium]|nr:TfoX/Sxy family protein [bacterium]